MCVFGVLFACACVRVCVCDCSDLCVSSAGGLTMCCLCDGGCLSCVLCLPCVVWWCLRGVLCVCVCCMLLTVLMGCVCVVLAVVVMLCMCVYVRRSA